MAEGGLSYNFQLSVLWSERQWNLYIRSVKKVQEHKEREMHFPLWTLPWLREQMAKMLAKIGSERICKMPTMPEWAKQGFLQLKFYQNSNNHFHSSNQSAEPNVEQEKVAEKKADDADHCPDHKWSDCWRHMPMPTSTSSGLAKRQPFWHGKR
jgi:hypothetical protein